MGPYVLPEFAYGTVGPSNLSLRLLNLESESDKYCNSHNFFLLFIWDRRFNVWDRLCFSGTVMGPYVLLEFAYGTVGPPILTKRFLKLESESEKYPIVGIYSVFRMGPSF